MIFKKGINPHYGKEYQLINEGKKHLAYFIKRESVFEHPDCYVYVIDRGGTIRYLICRKKHEHLLNKFNRICSMYDRKLISDKTAHVRFGLLLGYEKEDIKSFLHRDERFK